MLVKRNPVTAGTRNRVDNVVDLPSNNPEKSLLSGGTRRRNGRNNQGKITVRHRGGGAARKYRIMAWQRSKFGVPAKVANIEYDPNRTAHIALLFFADGEKAYVLAPKGLEVGMTVNAGPDAELAVGNTLPLSKLPVGVPVHAVEIRPGKGAQMVRSAGVSALIQAKDEKYATILLPSKEVRLVPIECMATLGEVGNADHKNEKLGKAGRRRHMGFRPTVRGAAMHPAAHPHGGGEGKNGIGLKHPKTPWGKPALGKKTRNRRKYSTKMIVRDRRSK
jgi:large subunit ribosomal protein L2